MNLIAKIASCFVGSLLTAVMRSVNSTPPVQPKVPVRFEPSPDLPTDQLPTAPIKDMQRYGQLMNPRWNSDMLRDIDSLAD